MPRNTELRTARDKYIRIRFHYHRKINPRWSVEAVIEVVADEFFLSQVTIVKILHADKIDVPTAPTVSKYNKAKAAEPIGGLQQTALF